MTKTHWEQSALHVLLSIMIFEITSENRVYVVRSADSLIRLNQISLRQIAALIPNERCSVLMKLILSGEKTEGIIQDQ